MLDRNDHRLIAQRQDLFHLQDEAPGAAFWHPRGWTLLRLLESRVRLVMERDGFQEVRTPQVLAEPIWRASGHLEHFASGMFAFERDERRFALKPASCPGHIQIALRAGLSYRDLPLRLGELGLVHRDEPSGAIQGLFRLRQFTQDDGHIFCAAHQVAGEVARFCRSLRALYAEFGFEEMRVGFSTRPASRAGADEDWDRAEQVLQEAARAAGLECALQPGEGAFYGPKLEFSLRDRLGRGWQCGTIQLDLAMPERFDLAYVDSGGERRRPALLHRAAFGSLERFLGILLEQTGGRLPPWLAPEQIAVEPLRDAHGGFAREVAAALRGAGLRVRVDERDLALSRKVRDARTLSIPFIVALGDREAQQRTMSLRGGEAPPRELPLAEGVAWLAQACRPPALA